MLRTATAEAQRFEAPAALLERCAAQDATAWRALYDAYVERVWRFLWRLGVPEGEIEDITQEVFVAVLRKLGSFDRRVRFTTWLFAIAVRQVRAHRRSWRRRLAFLASWRPAPGRAEAPDRALKRREAVADLQEILGRMSRRKRDVFVLYELEELDGPTIARVLGCPKKTVWSRLRHARIEFDRMLTERRALTDGEVAP